MEREARSIHKVFHHDGEFLCWSRAPDPISRYREEPHDTDTNTDTDTDTDADTDTHTCTSIDKVIGTDT